MALPAGVKLIMEEVTTGHQRSSKRTKTTIATAATTASSRDSGSTTNSGNARGRGFERRAARGAGDNNNASEPESDAPASSDGRMVSISDAVLRVFLDNWGLQYAETSELTKTLEKVDRSSFKRAARCEFEDRLKKRHPGLFASAESATSATNVLFTGNNWRRFDCLTWSDWRRFERNETESRQPSSGVMRWSQVTPADIENDVDVIVEISKDGEVFWHGCGPLRWSDMECHFETPFEFALDAILPQASDVFDTESERYPGLRDYHYWSGRSDCSLQQKSICKALYGINTPCRIHVHVVLRRRSTGKMVTIISASMPNQIIGEDYDEAPNEETREYLIVYSNSYQHGLFAKDDRLFAEISFSLYCVIDDEEKVRTQDSVKFTTYPPSSRIGQDSGIDFSFRICDEEEGDDIEDLVLRAVRAWRWG